MAGPRMLIICLCFIPLIYSYNIENRKFNQFENQRFYAARLPSKFVPSYDNCIPVQAINELKCSILSNVELFYGLFESVCQRHQLCYACGSEHGLQARHCDRIARMSMFDLCGRNRTTKIDCLTMRGIALSLLQQTPYQTHEISAECSHPCVLNFIYYGLPF